MTFMVILACVAGIAGCAITTIRLPRRLRSQGGQCAVFTAVLHAGILMTVPPGRDPTGMVIAMGLILVQSYSPVIAVHAMRAGLRLRMSSVIGRSVLMYTLTVAAAAFIWFPLWKVLR